MLRLFALSLLLSGTAVASPFTFGGHYGWVFSEPRELNRVVSSYNQSLNSSAPDIGTAVKPGVFFEYSINEDTAIGASFQWMSPWTSASVTTGGNTVSGRYDTHTNLFGIRGRHIFARQGGISLYLAPTLGLASYGLEGVITVNGSTSQSVTSSASGIFAALSMGVRYAIREGAGVFIEAGYLLASSPTLKVDQQKNSPFLPGDEYLVGGNAVKLDMSGPMIALGLDFSP